jgi:hypothetical protein
MCCELKYWGGGNINSESQYVLSSARDIIEHVNDWVLPSFLYTVYRQQY